MNDKVANIRFVRLATLALMSLLLKRHGVRYALLPVPESYYKRLPVDTLKATSRDAVCGFGLVPRDLRRFWPKVRVTEGCWEWVGSVAPNGYGRFRAGDDNRLAHRVSYEFFNGELPAWLTVDHLCANKRCVNPDHLEAVTLTENLRRQRERVAAAA